MRDVTADAIADVVPKLRGLLHAGAVPVAVAAGVVLVALSPTAGSRAGAAIFTASAAANFGISAALHRGRWASSAAQLVRRLDHASIFVLIAGSYTPFTILMLTGRDRGVLLTIVWGGAALGICFRLFWPAAPRWLYTVIYLVLGWAAVLFAGPFVGYDAPVVLLLMLAGGLLYTIGGVVYGMRRPNPSRHWFGFHEVFHALAIAAFVTHYIGVSIATYSLR